MQFLRIGRNHCDLAHTEVCECADCGANAGGRGQSCGDRDQLDDIVLKTLTLRRHHWHAGMDDVVDVAGGEMLYGGYQRLDHVLFKILLVPMLNVGRCGTHRNAIGSEAEEIIGGSLDHSRAEQTDALAPAEWSIWPAHGPSF